MESDDDYESFSFPNNSPSPKPHRRLKRLKKSTVDLDQSVKSVSELIGLPKIDFAKLEALESKNSDSFDDNNDNDSNEAFSEPRSSDGLFDDYKTASVDRKESKKSLDFDDSFDNDNNYDVNDDDDDSNRKEKELRTCFDDLELDSEQNDMNEDLESNVSVRKETKRALEFDDEIGENESDERMEIEGDDINLEIRKDDEEMKVTKKKRSQRSREESKVKNPVPNKRREAKERKAHLEQLHAESQRLLRETRGVSFKAVPLVQKPISSILERIRKRKLEVSKKFSQSYDLVKEDDDCLKEDMIDHPKLVETVVGELSESVEKEKVSSVLNGDSESNETDVLGEKKSNENGSSQLALDEDSTPVFRPPVDDTQELFGDTQTSDRKESEDEDPCDQTISSQEEEMGPSLLTMKLKFDSVPDDISEEEDNDKENVDPDVQEHSSPTGDPVKAFVDEEAEEEDDSDNERMQFGDDDEDGDDNDIEELNNMIATGYKERPVDLETRNELHQKWLQEKDAAGTDDLLRRLNVTSKLKDAGLLDEEDEEAEEDVEMSDDVEEIVERPRVARFDSKKAKEMIAQMFNDKDDAYVSSDDEETETITVREHIRSKAEEKSKVVSPVDDEDSREVFGLIKKPSTVPEVRKKAKITSFFDTMLTGGNRISSSKSSFLSRASTHSVPTSSKQGGSSVVRAFIFGRDDSNSRSSISASEDTSDATATREVQTKKVTTKYSSSQLQARSSTQTTQLVAENSSTASLFEILKQSSMQSNVENQNHKVELSQSVFAAFRIPKKPIKIHARV
uniref:probable serine/threonine-protein kinase kinX n=1 Tax=Erigeron canadensis TaxID=72917 RepID=UPI001CB8D028|nr:probable serine/threonine-protein kinase kinX [Erigeron canadensis]